MKQTQYFLLVALSAFFSLLVSCSKPTPAPSTEELMRKRWTAKSVTENGTSVFANGTGTKPGYSQFVLDLSSGNTATLRTSDGTSGGTVSTFVGTYTISGNTLTLTGLTPQPTGTNGTITFTIGTISETEVTLTRTTPDPKTGNSTNVYVLKNP